MAGFFVRVGVALLLTVGPAHAAEWAGAKGVACQGTERDAPHWIFFAGWTVQPAWAWTWANALIAAQPGGHAEAGIVCVVRGPNDAAFVRQDDIDTEAFAAWWRTRLPAGDGPVRVIAHSSGSFVAHRFFQHVRAGGDASALGRTVYFNLDGAIGQGGQALDADLLARLARTHAVIARDEVRGEESQNAATLRDLAARHPDRVRLQVLSAEEAGCQPGARWCLHQVLINRRPHNPAGFDLARDYGRINADHPVQADYLR